MQTSLVRTVTILCALAWMSSLAAVASAQSATANIVSAANTFLATLDEKQRQRVLFAFNDAEQRARWSNLPVSMSRLGGVSLKEMNAGQRSAAMAMLAAALSRGGFEKIQQIIAADEALKQQADNNSMFGKDLYYFSLLGQPAEQEPWMMQFGGHHLALNVTIAAEHGILTPTLMGAQPALYTVNGKTVRPLGKESDKAVALLNALDAAQRKQAILSYRLADLVLGPGQDGKTIQPEGLQAMKMNQQQRTLLLDLISEWSGIVHDRAAATRLAEIKAGLDETWFAWSGPIEVTPGRNIEAYYRIQGPNVVIEYAPQRLGGDPSLHVHSMYRDPTNDYGRKLTTK